LPPDVNRSQLKFVPEEGAIRYGLAAVKNVGEAAMQAALEEREAHGVYGSLEDYCERVDSRKNNRRGLESLVKCGAFDFTGIERSELFAHIEEAMNAASAAHRDKERGQTSLFDMMDEKPKATRKEGMAMAQAWSASEKLGYEKELLGFYVTGHPLDEYREMISRGNYTAISDLAELEDGVVVTLAGRLATVERKFTKRDNKPIAVVMFEDRSETMELLLGSRVYEEAQALLTQGAVVALKARVNMREGAAQLRPLEISAIGKPSSGPKPLVLTLDRGRSSVWELEKIYQILLEQAQPGKRPVRLYFRGKGPQDSLWLNIPESLAASPEAEEKLAHWVG